MQTNEYIVSLNLYINYAQFWQEMETQTAGLLFIPDRPVSIINNRDMMEILCHYALTEEEAVQLRNDPRVSGVEMPPEQDPDIIIGTFTNYNKTWTSTGDNVNWGLIRHSYPTNVYGTSFETTKDYNAVLDGEGVDVVITDTGIEYNHPEFLDDQGNSRVVQYNWTGLLDTSIGSVDFQDLNGHGTHVAGIVAGKNYGWAKKAKIYPMRIGLNGVAGPSIPTTYCFDYIKAWHIRKNTPGDPIYTGRPTVVNMSWGANSSYPSLSTITSINHRGILTTTTTTFTNSTVNSKGMITTYSPPRRVSAYDSSIQQLVDAGIIVCIAAGNSSHKIDNYSEKSDKDYNNYFISNGIKTYYHRGSSPNNKWDSLNSAAIIVGNMYHTTITTTSGKIYERRSPKSNVGPGIDVYAAGSFVMSACSTINNTSPEQYKDTTYKQVNISGTSMASPQIAGMCALYLQKHPKATPAEVKAWIKGNADKNAIYTNTNLTGDDYTYDFSQCGGSAGVVYQNIQGLSYVRTDTDEWKLGRQMFVKHTDGTWKKVKAAYKKEGGEWKQTYSG